MAAKILILSWLAFAGCVNLFAQKSNLTVFAEEGERFWVILNGLKQNEKPQTNVKIADINSAGYKLKVVFADSSLGEINKTMFIDPGQEYTFNVRKKKETGAEKELKSISDDLNKEFKFKKEGENKNPKELYVMRLVSQVAIVSAAPAPAPDPKPAQEVVVKYSDQPKPAPQTVVITEQTTTVGVHEHHPGCGHSASVGIQAGDKGVSVNMNINEGGSHVHGTQSTTTTTVVTSGHTTTTAPPNTVVYLPGYNGPTGCQIPMSNADFQGVKNSISSKSFEDSKLQVAKQVISSNCLFSSQVKEVMKLFDFENTRLDIAKYAYGYTYDLGNYYQVNDAFEFESSIDALNEYINSTH